MSAIRKEPGTLRMPVLMHSNNVCLHLEDPCCGTGLGSWTKLMAWFVWKGIGAFLYQSTKYRGTRGNFLIHTNSCFLVLLF